MPLVISKLFPRLSFLSSFLPSLFFSLSGYIDTELSTCLANLYILYYKIIYIYIICIIFPSLGCLYPNIANIIYIYLIYHLIAETLFLRGILIFFFCFISRNSWLFQPVLTPHLSTLFIFFFHLCFSTSFLKFISYSNTLLNEASSYQIFN